MRVLGEPYALDVNEEAEHLTADMASAPYRAARISGAVLFVGLARPALQGGLSDARELAPRR
jgi:hypothetical protein